MRKRLLILCDAFTPPAYVPRVRLLATNLQLMGWQVVVMTEAMPGVSFHTEEFTLFQMPYYPTSHGWRWAWRWLADQLYNYRERSFYHYITEHITIRNFDLVLCSSFNLFPLHTASRLARETSIPLVADLRDIVEQWGGESYFAHSLHWRGIEKLISRWYVKHTIRKRNKLLRMADAVTTISVWHKQFLERLNPNTHLIYNGFDERVFVPAVKRSEKFIISYTGRIYDFALRNPELVFEALGILIRKGSIQEDDIVLRFHVEESAKEALDRLSQKYGLHSVTQIEGYISQQETIELLQQSSICLLLANKPTAKGPFGIMTTKFFEILGTERPLLMVRSDEGVLAEAIAYTHAGVSARNEEDAMVFIEAKYKEWKTTGYTQQSVKHKEEFTRQGQAKQFAALFDMLIEK